jgi:hypothetical protein
MRPIVCIAATVPSRPWHSLLLLFCSVLPACQTYGSIDSLATTEARTPASEFSGRWRAPDPLRCRSVDSYSFGEGIRWSPGRGFEARGDDSGNVRLADLPDTACPAQEGDQGDTVRHRGTLVRLGAMRLLELSLSDAHLDPTFLPLRQWYRVTRQQDTLFLEALMGDSLRDWLQRSPTLTPHRFSPPSRGFTTEDSRLERRLVLTGDSRQLQSFARRAFAARSMVLDTIVLVRDRGAEASGP